MLGYLGVIQKLRELELSGEGAYWQVFQTNPHLRKACWELWLQKESVSLAILEKLLEFMKLVLEGEDIHKSSTLFAMHLKLQTVIELYYEERQVLEAKRKAKAELRAKREAEKAAEEAKVVAEQAKEEAQRLASGNNLPPVREHVIDLGETDSEKAIRLYAELEKADFDNLDLDQVKEDAKFIMDHVADDDDKNALVIFLKNKGLNDIGFLFQT